MRRHALVWLSLAVLAVAACDTLADIGETLEGALPEDSAEGKVVRGLNRLRKSFSELDPSEEHYIGRAVAAQVLSMPAYPLADEAALTGYLERITRGIALLGGDVRGTYAGYHVGILGSDEVNAFAMPGGTIFVSRGLIRLCESEDELAAVLAHEIAHVTLRHGLAAIQQGNLIEAFKYLGAGAAQVTLSQEDLAKVTTIFDSSINDIVTTLVKNGYSRDAEYEADGLAVSFLASSGYDPGALARVLARMGAHTGQGGFYATHPAGADRVAHLQTVPAARAVDAAALAVRRERFAAAVR